MRHARDIPAHVLDNLDKLREERRNLGITSGRFAEMVGITTVMLSQYETWLTIPQRKIYNRMARIFGWEEWKDDES